MKLSRREWLEGLVALGAVACSGRPAGRTLEGSIVGGAHSLGHRLRAAERPKPESHEETGIAILGAGIAGLSAAWTLERAGFHDFVVLELEAAPGGTARSGASSVTPFPWGAHYLPAPPARNRPLLALLQELGALTGRDSAGQPVFAENVLCREPQERVYFRGEWYEGLWPRAGASADDTAQFHAFEAEMRRWAGWRDGRGRRAFDLPRAASSDAPELRALDRMPMSQYLDSHGWNSPRLRWYVEYGCRDDFGATLAQTSAWAGIHYYAARLEDPGAEPAEFLTWPEGNGRLVHHLAGIAGRRLRTGMLVTEVVPGQDGVDVVCVEAATGRVLGLRAGHAIFALPRFVAGHVVAPWRESPPAFLREAVYGSWLVANLGLRDRPASRGFPLAWDNVLYDSLSLGYVVATHQAGRDHGPTVLTYYLPFVDADTRAARERMLRTSWEQWVRLIVADLRPAHRDLEPLLERVDVYLWGHAMVRPRPGYCWSQALAEAARPLGRLHFAHTDLAGMALFEEAQHSGIRAAEAVLRERRHTFRSWLGA